MNVSIRSQMVAGVAALGAAAVTVTPIAQPELLPTAQRVSAAVELSALVNPIYEIGGVLVEFSSSLFWGNFYSDAIAWPDSFYGVDFYYAPLNDGIISDVVNQFSTGPLVGLVNNLSGYLDAALYGLIQVGTGIGAAAFNTPFAAVDAVGQLIGGDPAAALNTLVTQIVEPVQFGIEDALAAVGYIVDNVIENAQTVLTSTLPFVVAGVIDALVQDVSYMAADLIDTVTVVLGDLAALDFEAAWNDAVIGLLGTGTGTLSQLVAFTTGVGLFEEVDGVTTLTYPSVRAVLTSELQRLGGQKSWGDGGITNTAFLATPAAADPAPAAALESAPVAAAEAASAPAASAKADSAPAAAAAPESPVEAAAVADVEVEAPTEVGEAAAEDAPAAAEKPVRGAGRAGARAADGDGASASAPKRANRGGQKAASAARAAS